MVAAIQHEDGIDNSAGGAFRSDPSLGFSETFVNGIPFKNNLNRGGFIMSAHDFIGMKWRAFAAVLFVFCLVQHLQCQNGSSIIRGGNTVDQNQGQCGGRQQVTTESVMTNTQGKASFPSRGITFLVQDLITQLPLGGMNTTLLEQRGTPAAVSIQDPNGNYLPLVSALNDLPVLSGGNDPTLQGADCSHSITYIANSVLQSIAGITSWSLPPSVFDAVQYQQANDACSSPISGSTIPQAVENFLTNSAYPTAIVDVSGISLGAVVDYVGGVIGVFQASDQLTALAYANYIAANSPNGSYMVCTYSGGNPLLGFDLITIQSTSLPTQSSPATIQGTVQDNLGNAVSGATITAIGANQQPVTTSASGTFIISNLQGGTYTVQATKAGYDPYSDSVSISAGSTAVFQITLSSPAGIVTGVCPNPLAGPTTGGVYYTGSFLISGENFQAGDVVTTDGPLLLTGSSTVNSTGTTISQGYQIGCCAPQQGQTFHLFVNTVPSGSYSISDTITLSSTQPPSLCAAYTEVLY